MQLAEALKSVCLPPPARPMLRATKKLMQDRVQALKNMTVAAPVPGDFVIIYHRKSVYFFA